MYKRARCLFCPSKQFRGQSRRRDTLLRRAWVDPRLMSVAGSSEPDGEDDDAWLADLLPHLRRQSDADLRYPRQSDAEEADDDTWLGGAASLRASSAAAVVQCARARLWLLRPGARRRAAPKKGHAAPTRVHRPKTGAADWPKVPAAGARRKVPAAGAVTRVAPGKPKVPPAGARRQAAPDKVPAAGAVQKPWGLTLKAQAPLDVLYQSRTAALDRTELITWLRAIAHGHTVVCCDGATFQHKPATTIEQGLTFGSDFRRKHGSLCSAIEAVTKTPGCKWQIHSDAADAGKRVHHLSSRRDLLEFIVRTRRESALPVSSRA